jgi:hypothetical protein
MLEEGHFCMKASSDVEPGNWRLLLLGGGALLCLLLFIGSSVPHSPGEAPPRKPPASNLNSPDSRPEYVDQPEKAAERADMLARQSNGDWNKLSQKDQRWLDAATAGYAREFLSKRAHYLRGKDRALRQANTPRKKHP